MANKNLEPALVFEQFAKINAIPRPSKHEDKMIAYLRNFGESRGLETKVDATGNVLIRKHYPRFSRRRTEQCVSSRRHQHCRYLHLQERRGSQRLLLYAGFCKGTKWWTLW